MLTLADNKPLTNFIARKGMTLGFAKRFVAGETIQEAINVVIELNKRGIGAILDYLGENISDKRKAEEASNHYLRALDHISSNKIDSTISIKLTQLGLDISRNLCNNLVETIVSHAEKNGNLTELDMEDSSYTDRTLSVYRQLRKRHGNIRVCIQAYLYRSEADINQLTELGPKIRLCKGAYNEPDGIAFQEKRQVDENYKKLMKLLFEKCPYPAIATHDEHLISIAKKYAEEKEGKKKEFEFQMLYGVRRDLQESLKNEGFHLRVYVPYGAEWCPYFMRRLAERPANSWFVIKNLIKD